MLDRDISIVDEDRLAVAFTPLAHASKERLEEELVSEQALISRRWGANAAHDLSQVQGMDAVIAVESYFRQKALQLEQDLNAERARTDRLAATKTMSEQERADYQRLLAEKQERAKKNERRRRQAAGKRRRS
jgi:epoxyqueuosine reductase QueG